MSDSRPTPDTDEARLVAPTDEARASFGEAFERLVGVMARLRGPDGCPWDQAQDLKSLRPYLIEEAYEVLEALDKDATDEHRDELGDLLLQVVFQAEIRRQEGVFDAADVAHAIADKLVRRHPHVFGDRKAADPNQAYARWEQMKSEEKKDRLLVDSVPHALPALLRAQRLTDKANRVGFDWPDVGGPLEKLEEEIGELREALAAKDRAAIEHELGDVLFTVVNISRFVEMTAEDALRGAVDRFTRRLGHVERSLRAQGKKLHEASLEEMEALWEEAKALAGAGQ